LTNRLAGHGSESPDAAAHEIDHDNQAARSEWADTTLSATTAHQLGAALRNRSLLSALGIYRITRPAPALQIRLKDSDLWASADIEDELAVAAGFVLCEA
jgi:hypothetical protein